MKFFLGFLLVCFFGGMLTRHLSLTTVRWLLAGVSIMVAFGYFFLNVI